MLTETQKERINELYIDYLKDIKPAIFYVERKFHKFPKALLKEFRDVFDHIARCYEEDATEEYKNENLTKAKNHFDRIKLDTFKYVSDYKKREFTRWKRKYSKYDLQNIDNGEFWKLVLDLEDEAEQIFSQARSIEAKSVVQSCELLQESTEKYDEIQDSINKKRELIIKEKFKYKKVSLMSRVSGFILGIATSIIAAYIWEYIIK